LHQKQLKRIIMDTAFKKILIAFDGSDSSKSALQSAYGVAKKFDSEITALVVSEEDINQEKNKSYLEDFSQNKHLKIEIVERSGAVYDEVIKLELLHNYSLILIGTHGTSGWKPLWMGGNAFKVISSSTCPVISVPEKSSSPELNHILLPLLDSNTTRQKVPYCIKLAKAFDSTVHVLGISKSNSSETQKHVRSYVNQTINYLSERGIKCTKEEKYGANVAESCISYGEEVNAGLMLIMTETESAGLFMGTYAQQLVNSSTFPVMSIHSRDTRLAGASGY
jgi:nucleotide-binding universal stress UspA family protein